MPSLLGVTTNEYVPPQRIRPDTASGEKAGSGLWDKDGFNFSDFLDVINPLQHIPIVSSLYRDITGDDIGHVPRVLGGALFGGVIGFVASLLNAIVDEETGKDVGEHVVAALFDGGEPDSAPGGPFNAVTVASAFSPVNDAIYYGDEAPALPAPDTPPVMLATATPPVPAREPAGAAIPAAPPALPPEAARAAIPAPSAAKTPSEPPPSAAKDATPFAAPVVPAATPASDEAGGEPSEASADRDARAALLSHFGGGEANSRPGPWISQAMMYGLDRYKAMALERTLAKPDIDSVF